jgi:hypothetical protein
LRATREPGSFLSETLLAIATAVHSAASHEAFKPAPLAAARIGRAALRASRADALFTGMRLSGRLRPLLGLRIITMTATTVVVYF